jgi:hypothetical protein
MSALKSALTALVAAGLLFAGCSKIPTSEFQVVKDKICACTDAACAGQLADEVKRLKDLGGSVDDEAAAKALLGEAAGCAKALDPEIGAKIQAALK